MGRSGSEVSRLVVAQDSPSRSPAGQDKLRSCETKPPVTRRIGPMSSIRVALNDYLRDQVGL